MKTTNSQPKNYYVFWLGYFLFALLILSFNLTNKELNRSVALAIQQVSTNMNLLFTKDLATTYSNFFTSAKTIKKLQQDNENLKAEIAKLHEQSLQITILQEKLKQLNSLLKIKENKNISKIITTHVMSNHFAALNTTLDIPLGTNDNINKNSLVISNLGVVGYIANTYKKNSEIITIVSPVFKISARGEKSKINVVVIGNGTLSPNLTIYSKNSNLISGENLLTSGLEGHFPPNIPIGYVTKGKSNKWQVQLFEKFSQINYVHIVK